MGARIYNPAAGLFTSTYLVDGGYANAYTYPTDPLNQFDLDGHKAFWKQKKFWKIAKIVGIVASTGICVMSGFVACLAVGLASAAISATSDNGGRFGGKRWWGSFGTNAGWAVAGAGVGVGIGKLRMFLGARHARVFKSRHARPTRWRNYRNSRTRMRGFAYYKAQASVGGLMAAGSNGLFKRRCGGRNFDD